MMPLLIQIRRWLMQPCVWRLVGFMSTVVGLFCYALSSSFNHLFGKWNILKIFVYAVFSIIISFVILFAKVWQHLRSLQFEAHMAFFILTITSIYSFFFDKMVKAKPDAYSLISYAAFAVTSLSMSRQRQSHFGFEVDLLYFFLGCLIVQFMKIKLWLGLAGVGFSYSLIILRSSLDASSKNRYPRFQDEDHLVVQVNSQEADIGSALLSMPQQAQQLNPYAFSTPQLLPTIEERLWANVAVVNLLRCRLNKYLRDEDHQIPVALLNDHNFLMDELPSQAVGDLHEKVMLMSKMGFAKECLDQYSSWRREFLQLAEEELNTEENDEKKRVKSWIKISNIFLRILFPNERRLCDRIFLGFSSFANRSFMEVCGESTTHILNFASSFAHECHSLDLLPSIFQVFGALHDLIPEFESVFFDQCSVSLRTEAVLIMKRLGEAIRDVFMELEGLICCDMVQAAIPGGICPITVGVMNHLDAVGKGKCYSLSREVTRIIELLESHLEAKSKQYTNPALGYVFLMNNGRYIEQKAKQYQLGIILGDDWVQQRAAKVQRNFEHYQRSSWDEVLGFLKLGNNVLGFFKMGISESMEPNVEEAESMKEKLNLFNLHFKEIRRDQSAWFINDEELREEIIKSLGKILSHAYGLFIWSFICVLGKHADEYISYSVVDIEDLLKELFKGRYE